MQITSFSHEMADYFSLWHPTFESAITSQSCQPENPLELDFAFRWKVCQNPNWNFKKAIAKKTLLFVLKNILFCSNKKTYFEMRVQLLVSLLQSFKFGRPSYLTLKKFYEKISFSLYFFFSCNFKNTNKHWAKEMNYKKERQTFL